jgi:hypothetical protein
MIPSEGTTRPKSPIPKSRFRYNGTVAIASAVVTVISDTSRGWFPELNRTQTEAVIATGIRALNSRPICTCTPASPAAKRLQATPAIVTSIGMTR